MRAAGTVSLVFFLRVSNSIVTLNYSIIRNIALFFFCTYASQDRKNEVRNRHVDKSTIIVGTGRTDLH